MSFWDNIARSTLRDIARAAGVRTSTELAIKDLEQLYGGTPGEAFIDEMWLVLRDGWLTRTPADRDAVVEAMLAKGRGNTKGLRMSTKEGKLKYLKTLKRGPGLTEVVLPIFLASGATERPEPVWADPPTTADVQAARFEEAIRAGLAAVNSSNINSLELAVLQSLARSVTELNLPVAEPESKASRIAAEALNVFSFEVPETTEDPLLDYQRVLVERIPKRFASSKLLDSTYATIQAAFIPWLSDPHGNDPQSIVTVSTIFWSALAFGDQKSTPDDFFKQLMEGQFRFIRRPDPGASTTSDLEDVLTEVMATIPNVAAPTRRDEVGLNWLLYMGSAAIRVSVRPQSNGAPAMIMFYSPLITGVKSSVDLLDVLNQATGQEPMIKFYVTEGVVALRQEVPIDVFSEPLFRYMLSRFAATADRFDTLLRDRFGGSTFGADQKAVFDA